MFLRAAASSEWCVGGKASSVAPPILIVPLPRQAHAVRIVKACLKNLTASLQNVKASFCFMKDSCSF
jgi:hypothetical protein